MSKRTLGPLLVSQDWANTGVTAQALMQARAMTKCLVTSRKLLQGWIGQIIDFLRTDFTFAQVAGKPSHNLSNLLITIIMITTAASSKILPQAIRSYTGYGGV